MPKKNKKHENANVRQDPGRDSARPLDPDEREREVQRDENEQEDTGSIEPGRGSARRSSAVMPDGTAVEGPGMSDDEYVAVERDAGGAEDEAIEGDRKGRRMSDEDEGGTD